MKAIPLSAVLILLLGQIASAQLPTEATVPNMRVTSTSPEAAGLGKYGDIPVGLYTGVPNISIPIYTIVLKGVKIPIDLSYHASGIQVDEVAPNTGLGWSLSYGGSVTSAVHGLPDLGSNGWATSNKKLPQSSLTTTWGAFIDYPNDTTYQFMQDAADGIIDTQPDLFTMNLNGRTAKFFHDQDQGIHMMPYQRLKFSSAQEVTDEQDILYKFFAVENSTTNYIYNPLPPSGNAPTSYQTPSYFISQITTPNKDTVGYEYESVNYTFYNQPSETRYVNFSGSSFCVTPAPATTGSYTQVSGERIKKIKTNSGLEINFTYSATDRLDLSGSNALTGIEVKNTITGQIICTYTLTYDYYQSCAPGSTDPNCYRLRLLSVKKNGENPYVFTYDTNALPERLSKSQDHWGYYNGASNTTLLPPDAHFLTGADRAPHTAYVQNGILKRITYPLKGYTDFEYEANESAGTTYGGVRIKTVTSYPLEGASVSTKYEYLGAVVPFYPEYSYVHNYQTYIDASHIYTDCQAYAQSSSSLTPTGLTQGGAIGYNSVNVYTDAKTKGYTNHKFGNFGGFSGNWSYPFTPVIAFDWLNGLPTETTDYVWDATTSTYKVVKNVFNEYQDNFGPLVTGPHEYSLKGAKIILKQFPIPPGFGSGATPRGPEFLYEYFPMYTSWSGYLAKTTEKVYDPANSLNFTTTVTNYYYDNPAHIQLTRQQITRSDGKVYKTLMRYPKDVDTTYTYNTSPVVEKRVMVNDGSADMLIAGELTTYLNEAGAPPNAYYSLKLAAPVAPSTIPVYTGSSVNSAYNKKVNFNYYADKNIKSVVKDNVQETVYLWSYKGQYPVAEITNASYAAVETALGGSTNVTNFNNLSNPTKATVDTFVNPLRTALPNAQITSYAYKLSNGILSQTDAKGLTTYFEYDDALRLKYVKDNNGDIVKRMDYNYAHTPVYNTARNQDFTKNDCVTGTGTVVTYTVPAETYEAASLAEANALADADIAANGQNYANLNGTCSTNVTVEIDIDVPVSNTFYVNFHNTVTNVDYSYTLTSGDVAIFPEGTYITTVVGLDAGNITFYTGTIFEHSILFRKAIVAEWTPTLMTGTYALTIR